MRPALLLATLALVGCSAKPPAEKSTFGLRHVPPPGGATVITSEAAEVGGQIGEMIYGDREWGDFDYAKIAKVGGKAAVTAFIGAVTGGKMGELVAGSFARYAAPWLAEAGINLNSKGMQILGSMGLNWISTAGSSPFVLSG